MINKYEKFTFKDGDYKEFFKLFRRLPDAAKVEILDEVGNAEEERRPINGDKIALIVSRYHITEN